MFSIVKKLYTYEKQTSFRFAGNKLQKVKSDNGWYNTPQHKNKLIDGFIASQNHYLPSLLNECLIVCLILSNIPSIDVCLNLSRREIRPFSKDTYFWIKSPNSETIKQ